MKKAIAALLAAAHSLSLAACGGGASSAETAETAQSTEAPAASTEADATAAETSYVKEGESTTLSGRLLKNEDAHPREEYEGFITEDPDNSLVFMSFWYIELDEPITFELNGEKITATTIDIESDNDEVFELLNNSDGYSCSFTGYFENSEYTESSFVGPFAQEYSNDDGSKYTLQKYFYYPNGNYQFHVTGAEVLSTETPAPTLDPSLITITGTVLENETEYNAEIVNLRLQNSSYYYLTSTYNIASEEPVTFELNGEEITGNTFDVELDYSAFSDSDAARAADYLIQDNIGATFCLAGRFEATEHKDGEVVPPEEGDTYSDVYFYPNGNYVFKVAQVQLLSAPWTTPDASNDLPQVTVKGVSDFLLYNTQYSEAANNYSVQYSDLRYPDYIITFDEPVTAEVDGKQVTVTEAALKTSSRIDFDFRSQYSDNGLLNGTCELTGSLAKSDDWADGNCSGPYTDAYGYEYYEYNPCEYTFYVTDGEYSLD